MHRVGIQAVEERLGDLHLLGLDAREDLFHVAVVPQELLEVPKRLLAHPSHRRKFPPQLATGTIEADLLPGRVAYPVLPVQGSDAVLHQADAAYGCMGAGDLEVVQESLKGLVPLGQVHSRLPERDHQFFRRGEAELVLASPPHPVVARPVPLRSFVDLRDSHRPHLQVIEEEDLVISLLGLDDDIHGAIRSWRT